MKSATTFKAVVAVIVILLFCATSPLKAQTEDATPPVLVNLTYTPTVIDTYPVLNGHVYVGNYG